MKKKFIKNTQLKYTQKYDCNYYTEVNVKCNVKFFDKIENKTKYIMIESDNITGEVNKIMHSSKGMIRFIRDLELTIRIQGRIHKNIVNAFLRCNNFPIMWKKHYLKIADDGGCKYNQHCCESYFQDFTSCNGCI